MKQSTSTADFNLSVKEYFANSSPLHRHNYFELIYVLSGKGIHIINDNQFAYARNDLFLLTPDDAHTFQAHEQSTFCIIDFTTALFNRKISQNKAVTESNNLFKQMEYVFQNTTRLEGYVPLDETDKAFTETLVRRLVSEWNKKPLFSDIVLKNLVFLLLNIIARYAANTTLPGAVKMIPENKAYEMITYLQHHIYENELLAMGSLALQFNLSKGYVGAYFKDHTGKSIKQFILDYKLELVKARLLYSDLTIAQIAFELNFTDDSHLNKAFKKKYGMTAKKYKELKYAPD